MNKIANILFALLIGVCTALVSMEVKLLREELRDTYKVQEDWNKWGSENSQLLWKHIRKTDEKLDHHDKMHTQEYKSLEQLLGAVKGHQKALEVLVDPNKEEPKKW